MKYTKISPIYVEYAREKKYRGSMSRVGLKVSCEVAKTHPPRYGTGKQRIWGRTQPANKAEAYLLCLELDRSILYEGFKELEESLKKIGGGRKKSR